MAGKRGRSDLARRNLPIILGIVIVVAIGGGALLFFGLTNEGGEPVGCIAQGDQAIIETSLGRIVIRFLPEVAPCHVENFITLAKRGFYDGTTFHRVIPGFMIQGGDPNTKDDDRSNDGMGGPGYTINAEFSGLGHRRGIVSMARTPQGPDTAGSQFFIVVKDSAFLDSQYTIFANVVEGMDVVDRIVSVERDANDNPLQKVVVERVTISGG